MNDYLTSFQTMEAARKRLREEEARKFREANDKLNRAFYRHSPSSHLDPIEMMHRNLAIHNETFDSIMRSSAGVSSCDSSESSSTSSSSSNNDSYSCSDSSSTSYD